MVRRGIALLVLIMLVWGVTHIHGQAEGLVVVGTEAALVEHESYTRDEVLQFMRNTAAPNFTLSTVNGGSVALSDLRGSIVVLSFWVSWDQACLENLALLNSAQYSYPGVTALMVNNIPVECRNSGWNQQAQDDHAAWVKGYLSENGFSIAMLMDNTGEVSGMHDYQGSNIPMTCFIDRQGMLRIPWQGQLSEQTLATLLSMMYALDP